MCVCAAVVSKRPVIGDAGDVNPDPAAAATVAAASVAGNPSIDADATLAIG